MWLDIIFWDFFVFFFKYIFDCNCRSIKLYFRMSEWESYVYFDLFKYINILYFKVLNFVGYGEIFVGYCMLDEWLFIYSVFF